MLRSGLFESFQCCCLILSLQEFFQYLNETCREWFIQYLCAAMFMRKVLVDIIIGHNHEVFFSECKGNLEHKVLIYLK